MKTYQLSDYRVVVVKKNAGELTVTIKHKDASDKFIQFTPSRSVKLFLFHPVHVFLIFRNNMHFFIGGGVVLAISFTGCVIDEQFLVVLTISFTVGVIDGRLFVSTFARLTTTLSCCALTN